jgi:predicted transcriptional regulator
VTNLKQNRRNKMVKVTEKEMAFLEQIKFSDYSNDGFGFTDYITDYDYDMKVVRGLIPSLAEKGIIVYDDDCGVEDIDGNPMGSAYITEDYVDIENHKLIKLEVA